MKMSLPKKKFFFGGGGGGGGGSHFSLGLILGEISVPRAKFPPGLFPG